MSFGLRAALEAIWGRSGAQEAPGALRGVLWTPWGLDFGASGAPFSKLPALLAERFLRSLPGSKRKRRMGRRDTRSAYNLMSIYSNI